MDKYIVLWANNEDDNIGFEIFPNYDEAYKFMKQDYEECIDTYEDVDLDDKYIDNETASFYADGVFYYWNIKPLGE